MRAPGQPVARCHGMPWNAMGNPEIKKHGAQKRWNPNIPNIPNSCSGTLRHIAQWSLQESFNGLESKHAKHGKHGIFVQPTCASCFKMVLGYPSVSNKTTVSTYYPEKKAAEETAGTGQTEIVSVLMCPIELY